MTYYAIARGKQIGVFPENIGKSLVSDYRSAYFITTDSVEEAYTWLYSNINKLKFIDTSTYTGNKKVKLPHISDLEPTVTYYLSSYFINTNKFQIGVSTIYNTYTNNMSTITIKSVNKIQTELIGLYILLLNAHSNKYKKIHIITDNTIVGVVIDLNLIEQWASKMFYVNNAPIANYSILKSIDNISQNMVITSTSLKRYHHKDDIISHLCNRNAKYLFDEIKELTDKKYKKWRKNEQLINDVLEAEESEILAKFNDHAGI